MDETKQLETKQRIEGLWRQEQGRLLAQARRGTRNSSDAEDLVQEVLVGALANLASLASVNNLAAWFFTALRNRIIDSWRRDRTRKQAGEITVAATVFDEIVSSTGLDPQDSYVREALNDALVEAINALPPEQGLVIQGQVFEGLSFRELSERYGVALDTLASRKRLAIKALGRALREWMNT